LKKCIVWDLDNTLWDGVHLEGDIKVRPEARQVIEALDSRGVLHSIASRGEQELALATLRTTGLLDYFLVPQINWEPKPKNIISISKALQVSLDSIVFVDDDPFELAQVAYMLPEVMTVDAVLTRQLLVHPCFRVEQNTQEAQLRRRFYLDEQARQDAQREYPNRKAFLQSCAMRLTLRPMHKGDLPRVLELMSRTHQLNTTGRVFAEEELVSILNDRRGGFCIKVADLTDRFGGYGTIGAAIVERCDSSWKLHLLAVSCRVLGRGVERAFLASLLDDAGKAGCALALALFRETGRNRAMLALYQMMGFRKCGNCDGEGIAEFSRVTEPPPAIPRWIQVV